MSREEIPAVLRRSIHLMKIYKKNQRHRQEPITIGIKNYKKQLQKYTTKYELTPSLYTNSKTENTNTH